MSKFREKFTTINLDELSDISKKFKKDKYRFVQMLATKVDDGVDLIYSFMHEDINGSSVLENIEVKNIKKDDEVPSITNEFIAAFVFENETHDLYGVNIKDIAIDFAGAFYNVAVDEPMTVLSPEAIARKEKQKKIEAALAAKKAKVAAESKKTEAENKEKGE